MPLSKEQQQTLLDLEPTVRSTARQFCRDHDITKRDDVEDYEGEAVAKVAEMIVEGKRTSPPGYVVTSVQNHLSDYRLENKLIPHPKTAEPPSVFQMEPDFDVEAPDTSIDDILDDVYFACSDDTDRRIVSLKYEGYTTNEIASTLGLSARTIRHRLQRIEETYDKKRHRRSSR